MQPTQCCTLTTPTGRNFDIIVGVGDRDPISESILAGTYDRPHAFPHLLELVRPGDRVLDLGAHIGTFSLMAAANGCQVVAVEASPYNAALVQASIAQNGFDQMQVISAAISDQPGELEFIQAGPFGLVAHPSLSNPTVRVPAMTVDAVLAQVGWQQVDLIKMDVEGSEVAAVRGMSQLFSRDNPPVVFYESNGFTLHFFAETPNNLLAVLEENGYKSYLAEPERLIPVGASDLQAACVVDYLAFKNQPQPPKSWPISLPKTPREIRDEVLVACAHPHEHMRSHTARTLEGADPELLADRRVRLALDRLSKDSHELVREAASWWATARAEEPATQRVFDRVWAVLSNIREVGNVRNEEQEERDPMIDSQQPDAAEFELEAADLDTEAIMQEIRARLRARRAEAKVKGFDFEAYADGLYPLPPDALLSRDLYESVRHLSLGYDKVNVDMVLTETRLPLVGGLAHKVRAALHELVLFYVNRLAAQQIRFNEQTASAMTALVRDLEAEIHDLRARVAELEAAQE